MYEQFFGLDRQPFKITPDTSLFYDGGHRGDILEALSYAIHRGEGIIKVVGEVGSGKTMLCRMLQQGLPQSVQVVYLANPSISAEEILFVIAREMQIELPETIGKHEVLHLLQERLLKLHAANRQAVLFVEEAQGMPLETLEEMRLLSNLETDQDKLLQIILFGQPELDSNLSDPSIRQLRERITYHFQLSPLDAEEIHRYLNFRMREVGYTGPEIISSGVAKQIEKASSGLLRRVNILADKALLAAFSDNTHTVSGEHVKAAIEDSEFGTVVVRSAGASWLKWGLLAFMLILLAVALWLSQQGGGLASSPLPQSTAPVAAVEPLALAEEEPVSEPSVSPPPLATKPLTPVPQVDNDVADLRPNNETTDTLSPAMATEALTPEPALAQIEPPPAESVPEVQVVEAEPTTVQSEQPFTPLPELTDEEWLDAKLAFSQRWLEAAKTNKYSLQVMTRNKAAASSFIRHLRHNWPLEQEITYVYEVELNDSLIYRVFYSEFASLAQGREAISLLPDLIQQNLPYLQSVRRMQAALLHNNRQRELS